MSVYGFQIDANVSVRPPMYIDKQAIKENTCASSTIRIRMIAGLFCMAGLTLACLKIFRKA